MGLFSKRNEQGEDGHMELVEHLAELRNRIFRMMGYVLVGMIATYNLFPVIYNILFAPAHVVLAKLPDAKPVFRGIQDAFLLRLETCLFAGIAVALPFIIYEIWAFVRPALTHEERKPLRFLAPFAGFLLLAGAGTGYSALPSAYGWMALYVSDVPDATVLQDAKDYLLLTVKILVAFALAFQLPVLLLFLSQIKIINSKMMVTYWRHAVVVIAALAAIFTPTNDPATMLLMAIPMSGLYLISIVLVKAFEPDANGKSDGKVIQKFMVSLVPLFLFSTVSFWLYKNNPVEAAQKSGGIKPTVNVKRVQQMIDESLAKGTKTDAPAPAPASDDLLKRIDALEQRIKQLEAKPATEPTPAPEQPLGTPAQR